MAQEKLPNRRRDHFVKRDFQFRWIMKFCFLVLTGAVISTGLLLLFSLDTLTSSFHQSRLVIRNTALAILPATIYTNLITLGLITLASIFVVLFISHKLAGPLFRFEKELKEIGEGDLTKRIRLRKEDQLAEMAESLNEMSARLHEKVLSVQAGLRELIELASRQNAPEMLIEEMKNLHQKIETNFRL